MTDNKTRPALTEDDLRLFEMQQQTDNMKLNQLQLLISAGCITINEVRERFGLAKLDTNGDTLVPAK